MLWPNAARPAPTGLDTGNKSQGLIGSDSAERGGHSQAAKPPGHIMGWGCCGLLPSRRCETHLGARHGAAWRGPRSYPEGRLARLAEGENVQREVAGRGAAFKRFDPVRLKRDGADGDGGRGAEGEWLDGHPGAAEAAHGER